MRGTLSGESRLRLPSGATMKRTHPIEVRVKGAGCRVGLQLEALFGHELPTLAAWVQCQVAQSLNRMTGLDVEAVDVTFTGVFPAEPVE